MLKLVLYWSGGEANCLTVRTWLWRVGVLCGRVMGGGVHTSVVSGHPAACWLPEPSALQATLAGYGGPAEVGLGEICASGT